MTLVLITKNKMKKVNLMFKDRNIVLNLDNIWTKI